MHNEIQKTSMIIHEFTSFLVKKGCRELDIKFKKEDHLSKIYITDYDTHLNDNEIAELSEFLNIQRQAEVEEYYWGLMGDTSDEDELYLLGSMIDKAILEKKDNHLYIELFRKVRWDW